MHPAYCILKLYILCDLLFCFLFCIPGIIRRRKTITGKRVLVFQCSKQEGDHPKQWEVVGVVKDCVTLFLASLRAPAEPPLSVVLK